MFFRPGLASPATAAAVVIHYVRLYLPGNITGRLLFTSKRW